MTAWRREEPGLVTVTVDRVSSRLRPVLALAVLMWVVTGVDALLLHNAWLADGVRPRDPGGLWPNALYAPFLHLGLAHLVANTLPFVVLGALVALQSPWRFVVVTVVGALVGAVVVWLLAPVGTVHVGASGLVFSYFGWLIGRALRERGILAIGLGLLTLVLYGGILWGLSPFQIGISWQGHLGGLLAGLVLAHIWPTPASRPATMMQSWTAPR
ncbi:MAG: rhomboid family intramembrane serine protease [Chloroflexi bacterium]|nr:rhomboid family intramembrane serine protease [Chloroflexota bacterium]